MFKRVLVPLDGSEFAEQALQPALTIAEKCGSEVIVLRVAVPDELVMVSPPRNLRNRSRRARRAQPKRRA